MKNRACVSIVLVLFLCTGVLLLLFRGDDILSLSFDRSVPVLYPSYAVAEGDGICMVDNSLRRLIKSDMDGNIDFLVDGGSRNEKSFYTVIAAVPDDAGNIYAITRTLDDQGFYTVRERVIRFGAQGNYETTLYTAEYSENQQVSQLVQRGKLTGLQLYDGNISWFELNDQSVNQYRYTVSDERLDFVEVMKFPVAWTYISSITQLTDDLYAYVTKDGYISLHSTRSDGDTSLENYYTFVVFQDEPEGEPVAEAAGENSDDVEILTNIIGDPVLYSGDAHNHNGIPSVPWFVRTSGNGQIYFSDLTGGLVSRLDRDGSVHPVISPDVLDRNQLDSNNIYYYNFTVSSSGIVYVAHNNRIIGISDDGELVLSLEGLIKPVMGLVVPLVFRFLFLCVVCASVFFLFRFYIIVMNRRISLMIKQIIIFIPITIAALLITSKLVFGNMSVRYQNELTQRLSLMVQLMTQAVDPSLFTEIRNQSDFMNESYRNIREQLHTLLNENRDEWNRGYYFALHRVVRGEIYTMMFLNDGTSMIHPFSYLNVPEGVYVRALRGEIATEKAADAWGLWMDAVGPIYNEEGTIVALLEVGKDYANYAQENTRLFHNVLINVLVVSVIFIILFIVISYLMLISIRNLRNGATMIAEGKLEVEIKASGNDEVTDLTISFNDMARALKKHVSEIISLNRAYYRFVPEQFLTFLHKKSVADIELGDQIQTEMTVMFSDIHSFTQMSEKMSPKENFDFLNTYLSLVGPVVRENNGFIDKYIGDAIMALFPHDADDAVVTSINILKKLYEFNRIRRERNEHQLAIGFGIHTGLLMLGILGEKERVDSTVISDNVNLASRLEGLTKKFGATIIVSGTTYDSLKNKELYLTRYLGKIQVKGKKEATDIYEILDGLIEDERIIRIKTRSYLHEAIELLMQQDTLNARKKLSAAYRIDPEDKAIQYYLKLARMFEKNPSRFSSTGIVMTEK